jgi:hypothetical protein
MGGLEKMTRIILMTKQILALFCLLASMHLFSAQLNAQNYFYFPYVVNDTQTLSELVFTNATPLDATVRLLVYEQDGTLSSKALDPVNVPSRSQVTLTAESLGEFRGWVLADSNVAGITGNLRLGSPDGSALEITEPAQPTDSVILPFVAQAPGTSMEISIVNPTGFFSRVDLSLYNRDGSVQASLFKMLGPYGMLSGSLASIFPGSTSFGNVSHIIARATPQNIFSRVVNIIGFEVVRGFQSVPQNIYARTDVAALTAVPLTSSGQSLVFPHVTSGVNWFSLLGLVNLTAAAETVVLSYFDDTGKLIPAPVNPASVSIPANGSVRLTPKELFGIADEGLRSGSVQVSSDGNLTGFLGVGTIAGASFTASTAQTTGQSEFLFPAVEETGESFTGIVLLNLNDSAVGANVSLISPAGVTLGTRHVTLASQQRAVYRVRDKSFLLEGLDQSGGYIFVSANAPLFAQAYLGVPDKTVTSLAPQVAATGFVPASQAYFVIRGTVTDSSGAPIEGVNLTLSKGANFVASTTTDASGEYLFRNLVSGIYVVKPEAAGRMFNPQSSTVTLSTTSNGAVNFSAIAPGLPVITTISPTETVARYEVDSPGLTLTVNGFGFTPTTRILFDDQSGLNGTEIFTTYVNSTQLTASLPAKALGSGGIYLIRARDAGFVSGEAVNFTIKNLAPQISSLDPAGPIQLGPGPGPIQLDLVVNGSNFHAAGTKDPGTLIGISITPDSYPAINPLIGSTPQCALVNSRFPFPIGVRAFDAGGNPATGISVTFSAPSVFTTEPTGSFFPGLSTVTVVTDDQGYAYAPVFTANPFAGAYVVTATATVSGFDLTTVFALTNLNPGDTCSASSAVKYVSSQQLIVSVSIAQTGIYTVQAVNSSPGGGRSELTPATSFVVEAGPASGSIPGIISLSPSSVKAGSSSFTLTVGGVNFQGSSWINFGTLRLPTEFVDGNTLRATVLSSYIASPGIVPITVTNPGDTGGTSRRVEFAVNP